MAKGKVGGSAQTLRDYWTRHGHGGPTHYAGADAIAWGTPGDFDRCVAQVSAHMTPEQAKGYCNLRHHDALGYYPATHAAMDKAHFDNEGYLVTDKSAGPRNPRDTPSGKFRTFQGEAAEASTALNEKRPEDAVHLLGSARALATGKDQIRLQQLQDSVARGHYGSSAFEIKPGALKVSQPRVAAGNGAASGEFGPGSGSAPAKDSKPGKPGKGGKPKKSGGKAALRARLTSIRQHIAKLEAELKSAKRAARQANRKAGATSTQSAASQGASSSQQSSSSSSGGSSSSSKPGKPSTNTVSALQGQIAALRTQEQNIEAQLGGKSVVTDLPAPPDPITKAAMIALVKSDGDLFEVLRRAGL